MELAHHLAAELDRAAVVEPQLLDPAADAVARLEHGHVGAGAREIPRGGKAGEAGPEDEHVTHGVASSRRTQPCKSSRAPSRSSRPR